MMLFVAQASLNQKAIWPAMLYLAGIIVVVGISIAVIAAIRRWSRAGQMEDSSNGLTLGQARQMRAMGLLTEQEFDQVKRVIVESTTNFEENRAATVREQTARLVDSSDGNIDLVVVPVPTQSGPGMRG